MLKMIESFEQIKIANVVIHVFADPGVGRTTLGNMAGKVVLADFDEGVHRSLGRQRVARFDAWKDLEEFLKHPWLDEADVLVIDTVGRALELLSAEIIEGNAKLGDTLTGLNQRGWGALKQRFVTFFAAIRDRRKDVILLSHAKMDKDKDGNKTATPDIPGGSAGEVFKVADAMGYLSIVGGKRVLDFNATDLHVGKNPAAWKPITIPEFSKVPNFTAAAILSPLKTHLNALSDEQTKVLAGVSAWSAKVDALEAKAEVFTAYIAEIEKEPHAAVKAQAKTLLWRRAQAVGLTFDKVKHVFLPPAPPTQEQPKA